MEYNFKINDFEGPLDLLLHLIKTEDIDIFDISIEKITKQYLEYINHIKSQNLDISSEYLVMSAELIELKSKYYKLAILAFLWLNRTRNKASHTDLRIFQYIGSPINIF